MDKIKIAITGRVASVVALPEVVADNAEYEIDFALDPREGWDMSLPITALFVRRDGSYTPRFLDAGVTSCTMPPQTGTNIVYVGLTQDDMRTTTPATIKVRRSIRTVANDPLPAPTEDVYAQILAAYAGIKTISGKGAPTSATQGKVNQLYRDEDTQKLYICTASDGGYTWAAVSGGSVDVDDTLTKAGYAADAKAAGDAIGKKIDAPQVAQVGEVLIVEEVDAEGKPKKWKTAPAAAEQKQADWAQNDETAVDYVKNRPFYERIINGYVDFTYDTWRSLNLSYPFVISLKVNGNEYKDVSPVNSMQYLYYYCDNYTITIDRGKEVVFGDKNVDELKLYVENYREVHTLSDEYIPDTIARTEQIVNPDWNLYDGPGAILNKPQIGWEDIRSVSGGAIPTFTIPSNVTGWILKIKNVNIENYSEGDAVYIGDGLRTIEGTIIQGNNLMIRGYKSSVYNNGTIVSVVTKGGTDYMTQIVAYAIDFFGWNKTKIEIFAGGGNTITCDGYYFVAV